MNLLVKLRSLWATLQTKLFLRRVRKARKLPSPREQAEAALHHIYEFIDSPLFGETPFTVIGVQSLAVMDLIASELRDRGWSCVTVRATDSNTARMYMATNALHVNFYISSTSLLETGWHSGIYGAALMCMSPHEISWNRFNQLKGRMRNNGTFFANGRYYQVQGVPIAGGVSTEELHNWYAEKTPA